MGSLRPNDTFETLLNKKTVNNQTTTIKGWLCMQARAVKSAEGV
jgi:hypothetical protein